MNRLCVLAKHWQPGQVKTRLARAVGADRAAHLQRGFVAATLARFADAADDCLLAISPGERRDEFAALAGPRWRIVAQGAGDLGTRMRRLLDEAWREGAERAVLVGSDSPTLPVSTLREAFARLREAPVVLGPAADGGYHLIGAAGRTPPVFEGVAWSTADVCRQTRELLARQGIAWSELPEWHDVDEPADLERLAAELRAAEADPVLAALRTLVDEVLAAAGTLK